MGHLLHAALRKKLGKHVQQKGSLVAPDRLRFDFSHFQPVTAAELTDIERLVNAQIRLNAAAETQLMGYENAVAAGAMALFGEKYDKDVRVLRVGDFSMELCGGTHVQRAGDIGLFKILSESGVASGVRRIEAITGEAAIEYVEQNDALLRDLAQLLRGSREDVRDKVQDALERIRQMEKEVRTLKDRLASGQGADLAAGAVDVDGVKIVATKVEGADAGALRSAVDRLKVRLKSAVVVLASVEGPEKVVLVAGVTADQTARIKAGELAGVIAAKVGGRGGGTAGFRAGGRQQPGGPRCRAGVRARPGAGSTARLSRSLPTAPEQNLDPDRLRPVRGFLILLACGVLGVQCARAADPQPYKIDWTSSGDKTIDSTMKLTSQLATLRESAPVDPFGLIARARGDVNRLQTVLQSFGDHDGSVVIKINGMGLDSEELGNALSALPKKSEARIGIVPTLGPLFHVGNIQFKGSLPPGFEHKLHLATGAPVVASNVLTAGGMLQTELQDAGYAFATVDKPTAYERPARKILDLTFAVSVGPRVRIGQIRIEGLKDVRESFVDRGLLVRTGEQYDASAIEKARENLLGLGVFSTVSVELGKPDSRDNVPITFVVNEAKKYTVGVSAAYSSDLGGSTGFNWSDHNVFGSGQQLTASASAINLGGTASTGLGYDATVGYSIPDFRRPDQTLGFSVLALRQALQAYTQTGETAGTSLVRKLSTLWNLTTGLSYEHEIIGQESLLTCPVLPPGAPPLPQSDCQPISYKYNLLMLPVSAAYDSTELVSPLDDATHGFRISMSVTPTLSHGGATSGKVYTVVQGTISTYFDVNKLFAVDPPGAHGDRCEGVERRGARRYSVQSAARPALLRRRERHGAWLSLSVRGPGVRGR